MRCSPPRKMPVIPTLRARCLATCFATCLAPLLSWLAPAPVIADAIHLDADFDAEPLDAPLATGGPELGQPIYIAPYVTAIVRGAPMPSPCLEIVDIDDYYSGTVRFEFLGGAEITSGTVAVTLNLRFETVAPGHNFHLGIREQAGAARNFATLDVTEDGSVYLNDGDTASDLIGTWSAGRRIPVGLDFDMDARTYDIWLDGVLVRYDETHGIAASGVGSLLVGCTNDADLEGRFFVDDILVSDVYTPAATESGSWGTIKSLFR